MLPVAVDLHRDVVAVLEREAIAGLHRAADAEVERQPDDVRAPVGGHPCGAVRRAVVDDDDDEAVVERPDLVDHTADRLLFVQRRHDRDPFELGELIGHGHEAQYGYRPRPSSFRAKPVTPSAPLMRIRLSV